MKKNLLVTVFYCFINISYGQPGMPDPSFGINGIVKTDIGAVYPYATGEARQVLTGQDGSIYILSTGAYEYYGYIITKRLPDGSIDSAYGNKGYSKNVLYPSPDNNRPTPHATFQPDGKIVVTGIGLSNMPGIVRFNIDGSIDTGFRIRGLNNNFWADAVTVQPDGKILLAGSNHDQFGLHLVTRLNQNGLIDSSFNKTGNIRIGIVTTLSLQADGKIITTGYAEQDSIRGFAVSRYNKDGTTDSSFDKDGTTIIALQGSNPVCASIIQPDGKIVLVGPTLPGKTGIVRLHVNGSLDSSFNGSGLQTIDIDSRRPDPGFFNFIVPLPDCLVMQNNDKIIIAGRKPGEENNYFVVTRLNTDGSPDSSFADNALLTTNIDGGKILVVQSDNKIIVAGDSAGFYALGRYNLNGAPDNTFGNAGKMTGYIIQGSTYFNATALQADGKLVAVGRVWNGANYDFAVARYNTNGSLDSSFSKDGLQTAGFGPNHDNEAKCVVIQPDGKILVAGSPVAVARFNTDGSPDSTFGNNGTINVWTDAESYRSICLQRDGKILLAGNNVNEFVTVRLNAGGTIDFSFAGDGVQTTNFGFSPDIPMHGLPPTFTTPVASMINSGKDGKIVVAGYSDFLGSHELVLVAKYNIDGSPDSSFSEDGKKIDTFALIYFKSPSRPITIQNDGKMVVAGNGALARYLASGGIDTTFGDKGFRSYTGPQAFIGTTVAVDSIGRIAIAGLTGNFTVALFQNDGSPDSSFGVNGIQIIDQQLGTGAIQDIQFQNNGLYLSGYCQCPGSEGMVAKMLLNPLISTFTSSTNGNWNNPAIWTGGIIPSPGSQVIVRHNVLITANASCYSLKVEQPGGSVTVNAGVKLLIAH